MAYIADNQKIILSDQNFNDAMSRRQFLVKKENYKAMSRAPLASFPTGKIRLVQKKTIALQIPSWPEVAV